MAVTLRYSTEFGKPALQKTICGGIYARVYCIFSACTMSLQRKFTFAISSPDELLVISKPTSPVSLTVAKRYRGLYGPAQKNPNKIRISGFGVKNIRKSGFEKVDGYCKPYTIHDWDWLRSETISDKCDRAKDHSVHFGFATVNFRKMAEASRRGKQKRKQVLKVTYCHVFVIVKYVLLIVLEGVV